MALISLAFGDAFYAEDPLLFLGFHCDFWDLWVRGWEGQCGDFWTQTTIVPSLPQIPHKETSGSCGPEGLLSIETNEHSPIKHIYEECSSHFKKWTHVKKNLVHLSWTPPLENEINGQGVITVWGQQILDSNKGDKTMDIWNTLELNKEVVFFL